MGSGYNYSAAEWRHQAPAWISQAAAALNNWYTVLAATGVYTDLMYIAVNITAANETLELEVTIDGRTIVTAVAAVAGTIYQLMLNTNPAIVNDFVLNAEHMRNKLEISGHDVMIRVRKTTNVGAGTLNCKAHYAIE